MAKREVKQWITVNGVHVPIFEGESKQEAVERHYRKTAGKQETKIRNMDDNWTRKLSRGEKAAMQMEVERERKEAGNPVKLSWGKTHSKLDQHSEIQKMAEEHVRKIWTKGGVYNKELYDEADKFAEKHNLDKKKVRDAAIKAMNEKYADSLKRKKNGEDPVKSPDGKIESSLNNKNFQLSTRNGKYIVSYSSKLNGVLDTERSFKIQEEAEKTQRTLMAQQAWTWDDMEPKEKAMRQELDKQVKEYDANKGKKDSVKNQIVQDQDLKEKQIAENKKQAEQANGKKESFVVGNNPPTTKEQAYMNYKAITISKNMPKAQQDELKRLKAQYKKEWKRK